jgi:hypothetical protein
MRRFLIAAMSLALVYGLMATARASGAREQISPSKKTQIAYLHVTQFGEIDYSRTSNIKSVGGGNGIYCIDVAFTPKSITATMSDEAPAGAVGEKIFAYLLPGGVIDCTPDPANAIVVTFGPGGSSEGIAFFATFFG